MSRSGKITVDCDSDDCYESVSYGPSAIEAELADMLKDDGWHRKDDKDVCPECWAKDNYEPPDPDGEIFRGREASGYTQEQQAEIMRDLKR